MCSVLYNILLVSICRCSIYKTNSTKTGEGVELSRSNGISINLKRFCQVKMYMVNPIATGKKVTLKIEKVIKESMMLYQKLFTYYKRITGEIKQFKKHMR